MNIIHVAMFIIAMHHSHPIQRNTVADRGLGNDKIVEFAGGPYCGIYSAYCALRSIGIEVSFEKLFDKKYVGSYKGSSTSELIHAIDDAGAFAVPLQGLSPAALRLSPCPLIMHVKRPGYNMPYAHWVLYLGMTNDNNARLIDPPYEIADLPIADLLSLWDGTALAVTREPVSKKIFWFFSCIDQAVALALCAVTVALIVNWKRLLEKPWLAVVVILIATFASSLLYHWFNEEGIAKNSSACGLVAGGHFKPELPKFKTNEIKELLDNNAVQLIDARGPEAFKAFHLPGAINLPVYAGLAERSAVYAQLPLNRKIVVYCNNEQCQWAEIIASDMALRGNMEFALYPGGIAEWVKQAKAKK